MQRQPVLQHPNVNPFPPGTYLINLYNEPRLTLEELHCAPDTPGPPPFIDHFTPLSSLWVVESLQGNGRQIGCPKTGALINVTIERLTTEFTDSLLGWQYITRAGSLHTVTQHASLRDPYVTVADEKGDPVRVERDHILVVATPPNRHWDFDAQGYILR